MGRCHDALAHFTLASGRHDWSVPARCPLGRDKGERVEDMTLRLCLRSAGDQLQRVRRKQGVDSALRQCPVSRSNGCTDVAGRRRTRSGRASGRRASQARELRPHLGTRQTDRRPSYTRQTTEKGSRRGPEVFSGTVRSIQQSWPVPARDMSRCGTAGPCQVLHVSFV